MRMFCYIGIVGLVGILSMGCATSSSLKHKSAAATGCPPNEAQISNKKHTFYPAEGYTYRISCNGRSFYCESTSIGTKCGPTP